MTQDRREFLEEWDVDQQPIEKPFPDLMWGRASVGSTMSIEDRTMSIEDLKNIISELKQGSYHISEALRLAQSATQDIFSVYPILYAMNLIRGCLGAVNLCISNDCWFTNVETTDVGWNPMRSQFLNITGLHEKNDGN